MNERIKELAEQADSYAKAEYEKWTPTDDFSGVPHIRNIFNEKFAELLIQECVRCAEGEWIRNGDTEHNRAVSGVIESIKERFGVEQN